jgi:hyperosmotically inducible protein
MKKSAILLSIVFAAFVSACAPTQTSRSTGQTFDDAAITTRVKTNIAKTEGIGDAVAINVDTYRGVVSLAGFVDNQDQKEAAEKAAKNVPGVVKVENNLSVKPRQ